MKMCTTIRGVRRTCPHNYNMILTSNRAAPTNYRVTNAGRGRPNLDWGQELLRKIHRYRGTTRREVYELAQDRRLFHQFIERL